MSSEIKITTFLGSVETESYLKKKEADLQLQRKIQVRQQEMNLSKQNINKMKDDIVKKKLDDEKQQKFQEYQKKKEQLEQLQKLKEASLLEIGEAHKQAQLQETKKIEYDQMQQIKKQEFEKNQKTRQFQASKWLQEEYYDREGKYKEQIQKRQHFIEQENQNDIERARKHQENLKSKSPAVEDPICYEYFDKNISKKGYYKAIDYSKTHYHNPLVIKHSEEETDIDSKELAKQAAQKTMDDQQEKELIQQINKQKQEQRGRQAIQKEQDIKVLQQFNNEMEKVNKAEQDRKIKEGKQNPQMKNRPATAFQKKIQSNKKIEEAFEKEFFGEKAEWAKEEIEEKDIQHMRSSSVPKISKRNNFSKSKSPSKIEQFEQKQINNKINGKRAKSVKIFRKSMLDTGLYGNKNKKCQQKEEIIDNNKEKQNLNYNQQNTQTNQLVIEPKKQVNYQVQQLPKQINREVTFASPESNIQSSLSSPEDNKIQNYQFKEQANKKENEVLSKKQNYKQNNKSEAQEIDDDEDEEQEYKYKEQMQQRKTANQPQKYQAVPVKEEQNEESSQEQSQLKESLNSSLNTKQRQQLVSYTQKRDENKRKQSPDEDSDKNQDNLQSPESLDQEAKKSASQSSSSYQSQQNIQDLSREDVKKYILEQEQFLQKLENDRKAIREKMRQEEQNLLKSLQDTRQIYQKNEDDQISSPDQSSQNKNNEKQKNQLQMTPDEESEFQSSMKKDNNAGWQSENSSSKEIDYQQNAINKRPILIEDNNLQSSQAKNKLSPEVSSSSLYSSQKKYDQGKFQQSYSPEQDNYFSSSGKDYLEQQFLNKHQQKISDQIFQENQDEDDYEEQKEYQPKYNQNQNLAKQPISMENYSAGSKDVNRANMLVNQFLNSHKQKENNVLKETIQYNIQENNEEDKNEEEDPLQYSKNSSTMIKPENFLGYSLGKDKPKQYQEEKLRRTDKTDKTGSPMSELSYSLSDIDKSNEKMKKYEYLEASRQHSLSNKKKDQIKQDDDEGERKATAKFGQKEDDKQQGQTKKGGVKMDIFDQDNQNQQYQEIQEDELNQDKQPTLAEMFKKNRGQLAKKFQEQQKATLSQSQEDLKATKPMERTKEEILQLRKKMMQRPAFINKNREQSKGPIENSDPNNSGGDEQQKMLVSLNDPSKKIKDPNPELMDRLALGKKAKVDKKDYLALTSKNYELLPEVKRRKEEERKKEDLRKRQEKVKELDKQIRQKKDK